MDLACCVVRQHIVDFADMADRVLARDRFGTDGAAYGDQAVDPVAASDLAGVGILRRSAEQAQIDTSQPPTWLIQGVEMDPSLVKIGQSGCKSLHVGEDGALALKIGLFAVDLAGHQGHGHGQVDASVAAHPHDFDVFAGFGIKVFERGTVDIVFQRQHRLLRGA